jgi:hypothetical protein
MKVGFFHGLKASLNLGFRIIRRIHPEFEVYLIIAQTVAQGDF